MSSDLISTEKKPRVSKTIFRVVHGGTQRGKMKLVDTNGFSYTVKHQTPRSRTWRCSVRGKQQCKATVSERDGRYQTGPYRHLHKPNSRDQELLANPPVSSKTTRETDTEPTQSQKVVHVVPVPVFIVLQVQRVTDGNTLPTKN